MGINSNYDPNSGTPPTPLSPMTSLSPLRVALNPNDPEYLKKMGQVNAAEQQHQAQVQQAQVGKIPGASTPTMTQAAQKPADSVPGQNGDMPTVGGAGMANAPLKPQRGGVIGHIESALGGNRPDTQQHANDRARIGQIDAEREQMKEHPNFATDYPKQQGLDAEEARLKSQDRSPLGKFGHVLSTIGNIAGAAVAPGVMANIPGSMLNNRLKNAAQQRQYNESVEQDINAGKVGAEQTAANAKMKEANTPKPTTLADWQGAQASKLEGQTNPDTGKPYTQQEILSTVSKQPPENLSEWQAAEAKKMEGQVNPATNAVYTPQEIMGELSKMQKPPAEKSGDNFVAPGGKVFFGHQNDKGQVVDENNQVIAGATKQKPVPYAEVVGPNQSKREISDYTKDYATKAASFNDLRGLIKEGQNTDPNQVANSLANLGGALMVTSANGVHRVNTYEAGAWGGADGMSAAERVNKWLDKNEKGAVPPEIAKAWSTITDIYAKNAYQSYLTEAASSAANQGLSASAIQVSMADGSGTTSLADAQKKLQSERAKAVQGVPADKADAYNGLPKGAPIYGKNGQILGYK